MLDTGWLHSSQNCGQPWGEVCSAAAAAQSNTTEQLPIGSMQSLILFSPISLQLLQLFCAVICDLHMMLSILGWTSIGNRRKTQPPAPFAILRARDVTVIKNS